MPSTRHNSGALSAQSGEAEFNQRNRKFFTRESPYSAIQATEPQTVTFVLNDSPAGRAAWVIEKRRTWSDCGGDVESRFSKDDLATTLTIDWTNRSYGSSAGYYYECVNNSWRPSHDRQPVFEAPTGIGVFPRVLSQAALSRGSHWHYGRRQGAALARREVPLYRRWAYAWSIECRLPPRATRLALPASRPRSCRPAYGFPASVPRAAPRADGKPLSLRPAMPALYMNNVLPTLAAWRRDGHRAALATLIFVDGSAPRPRGSQMAIREDGTAVGNLTGGCAEAAIIAEAQHCLASGTNRVVRYGKNSPYIDIRLPCGSGIDVFFDVTLADADLERVLNANAAREAAALVFDLENLTSHAQADLVSLDTARHWARLCEPAVRIWAVGKGPLVPLIAQLGTAAEFEVIVCSSEPETLAMARPYACQAHALTTPDSFDCGPLDAWTAFVSLFHEHEWDPPIIDKALASRAFYVGALGSKRTAAARRETLLEMGLAAESVARLHGPVGLDLGARSPPEIALAILGQIVQVRRRAAPAS